MHGHRHLHHHNLLHSLVSWLLLGWLFGHHRHYHRPKPLKLRFQINKNGTLKRIYK